VAAVVVEEAAADCLRRSGLVAAVFPIAFRWREAARQNRVRDHYCPEEAVGARRSTQVQACSAHSVAVTRWLEAVAAAEAFRSKRAAAVVASPMLWTSFRSAFPNRALDRCCREQDWAPARRSTDQECLAC
jgi:hypothetical protein